MKIIAAMLVSVVLSGGLIDGPEQGAIQNYQVGPGDVLSIYVAGAREFNQTTRVSNSGRIRVPYVGIMLAVGLTTFELEQEIVRKIMEHELVTRPAVRVNIEQFRAQPAYVVGEVNAPGQFVVTQELYVLDLISKAGGLLPNAAQTAFLYRRSTLTPQVEVKLRLPSDERPAQPPVEPRPVAATVPSLPVDDKEVMEIDLVTLQQGTRPDLNVRLEAGDILYIPRRLAQSIFVIGDVRVPGIYTLPSRGEITAAQAVIYAGGPLPTAKVSNGFLMRYDSTGTRQSMPVDFRAILDGRQPDIPVKPNDIIFIPNSAMRTIGIGLLRLGPRLIQQFAIF